MIKFEFTVEDVDAENIMSCLSDRINKENMDIMDEMVKQHQSDDPSVKSECEARIAWLRASIEYTKGLKKKMKNTRVEE
jgi:uncharacterized small protein (DUF1192 family)